VKPQFRRHGIGRRLIDAILQWLRQQEIRLVELTVATNNEAVAFWERLGFSIYMQQMKKDLQD
jgi:ribosomal protein S18 acetylase RimI-like enzyme